MSCGSVGLKYGTLPVGALSRSLSATTSIVQMALVYNAMNKTGPLLLGFKLARLRLTGNKTRAPEAARVLNCP
jgi:hypothetical protein